MSATDSAELARILTEAHPDLAPALNGVARRSLLKAMAASLALAGLSGCDWRPDDDALPYVNTPENVQPGKAKWYASAVTLNGFAQPILGKTYVGRPVKLEGNPDHPLTRGAGDAFLQAALLGLYDPERSRAPRHLGRPASWTAFDAATSAEARALDGLQGEGFRLLTGTVTSPTLARQIAGLLERWPKARWHVLEPINEDQRLAAARLAFGRPLLMHYQLDQAEAVASFDDDFLGPGPRQAVHARRWAERRLGFQAGEGASRLFVAEPMPSLTGIRADQRLVASVGSVADLVHALANAVGAVGGTAPTLPEEGAAWLRRAIDALTAHRGRALVTVGPWYSPEVQALGLLINDRIGAVGATLRFTDPVMALPPDGARSFAALVSDMAEGRVRTLAVLETNPAYAAPGDLDVRAALDKVSLRIHAGLHHDETAAHCHWHIPVQHDLETWSDARARDGTVSLIQPLVRPFYSVRSRHAFLANLGGTAGDARAIVQDTWRKKWGADFDGRWRDALYRGFVPETAASPVTPSVGNRTVTPAVQPAARALTLAIRPDPTLWDGRFATNAWLQELPKPITKVTWGNVIAVSPALAGARGWENGDRLRLSLGKQAIIGAAWVVPGQDAGTVALTCGSGRDLESGVAAGLGYNAFPLATTMQLWHRDGMALEATGESETVATTQPFHAMDGYDFVRTVAAPDAAVPEKPQAASFYPERKWDSPSWGMSIDLDLCIGCNACVVACDAENNVPMVGKELAATGRAMHWLRVDHYFEGDAAAPKFAFQPVPCMHCEQAPCEMGCPVNATVHSSDGLNLQVYNRCVGTRTCSAYCPYKVRRFNWFDFTGDDPQSIRAMRNPDVTVRQRGVMEKCTYCVQRIREARIAADLETRAIRDGEVVTACQQACPAKAIVFGDILDPESAVTRRKAGARDYALLEEANTRPRTTYLARIEPSVPDEKGEG
jgi:molybdopterin-containing oxidoreductase family iron-sulfur binding subunit